MLIQNIRLEFDKIMLMKYNFNQKLMSDKNKLLYLYTIFNYSVINKDIKTFLLFLYLHDTFILDFESKDYKNWKLITTANLSYEINKITVLDLNHYKYNIQNLKDFRILKYLEKNICSLKYFFLIPNSWDKLNNKRLLQIYCKTIGKIMCLYRKIL